MDLGALLGGGQPQMAAQPDPGLKGEWDGWMQNPANKAALLSFGLNLMNGSWGGPAQAFAQAAGAGVEAAVGTQEAMDAEANRQAAIGRDEANKRADRQLRRDLNREDNAAAMERTRAGTAANREQARIDRLTLAYDRQEASELAAIEKLQAKAQEAASLGLEDPAIYNTQLENRKKRLEAIQAKRDALLGVGAEGGDVIAGPETSVNPGASASPVGQEGVGGSAVGTSANTGAQTDLPPNFISTYNSWPEEKRAAFDSLDDTKKAVVLNAYRSAGAKAAPAANSSWLTRGLLGVE